MQDLLSTGRRRRTSRSRIRRLWSFFLDVANTDRRCEKRVSAVKVVEGEHEIRFSVTCPFCILQGAEKVHTFHNMILDETRVDSRRKVVRHVRTSHPSFAMAFEVERIPQAENQLDSNSDTTNEAGSDWEYDSNLDSVEECIGGDDRDECLDTVPEDPWSDVTLDNHADADGALSEHFVGLQYLQVRRRLHRDLVFREYTSILDIDPSLFLFLPNCRIMISLTRTATLMAR